VDRGGEGDLTTGILLQVQTLHSKRGRGRPIYTKKKEVKSAEVGKGRALKRKNLSLAKEKKKTRCLLRCWEGKSCEGKNQGGMGGRWGNGEGRCFYKRIKGRIGVTSLIKFN